MLNSLIQIVVGLQKRHQIRPGKSHNVTAGTRRVLRCTWCRLS